MSVWYGNGNGNGNGSGSGNGNIYIYMMKRNGTEPNAMYCM